MSSRYTAIIKPRSGLAVKFGVNVLAGVLDSDYEGEVKVLLTSQDEFEYSAGDAIAQILITTALTIDRNEEFKTDLTREDKGFGSTDEPV